jgi:hypothetical protein
MSDLSLLRTNESLFSASRGSTKMVASSMSVDTSDDVKKSSVLPDSIFAKSKMVLTRVRR